MNLILFEVGKQLGDFQHILLTSGIFMLVILLPMWGRELARKKLLKSLTPEEKFILKQLYLNDEFFLQVDSNNEFMIILEKKGMIFEKISVNGNKIRYKVSTWVKNEIENNWRVLTY